MLRLACTFLMSLTLLAVAGQGLAAPIVPSSPTTLWTSIDNPSSVSDPSGDNPSNRIETDVVGDANDPAFYTIFDDAGTPSTTDGSIGFRVRVSGDSQVAGFNNFLMIGMDFGEDASGDVDLFLGVDGRGQNTSLAIYHPGATANVSPATTSLTLPAAVSYGASAGNYDFSAVDGTIDPGVTTTDFGSNGTDRFVSFVLPFDVIVTEMLSLGISIDEESEVRYVMGTGKRPDVLDQDLSGTASGWTAPDTWDQLGMGSYVYLLNGTRAPEPGSGTLVAIGLLLLGARRRAGARS